MKTQVLKRQGGSLRTRSFLRSRERARKGLLVGYLSHMFCWPGMLGLAAAAELFPAIVTSQLGLVQLMFFLGVGAGFIPATFHSIRFGRKKDIIRWGLHSTGGLLIGGASVLAVFIGMKEFFLNFALFGMVILFMAAFVSFDHFEDALIERARGG